MVDEKITELTELTTPVTTDFVAMVDDPSGAPVTKRVTVQKLLQVGLMYDAYVCVRDKKTQNTAGGTFTSGAWQTRDLNDEQADTASIASVASNQVTLAAGTYRCLILAPAYYVDQHQSRLQNVTDGTTLLVGTNEFARVGSLAYNRSFIIGRFTLAAQKVLEVQHRCTTTAANNGFGIQANFTDEIYTVAEFWREM